MVLGLRTKTRRSSSIHLDYIVHILEIKPWPPSQSLRAVRSVLIQWENGDKYSGLTNQVAPSLGTGSSVGDGKIEINESFRLPFTLNREISIKGGDVDSFQKNCIEFNLYEPRRDKFVKGQPLGTAILDLAEYGVLRETLSFSVPISCKRIYGNSPKPLLFLKIQPVEMSRSSSSSRENLLREASMDRSNGGESVSALMNEEYAEEAEVASFTTDDDVSSHSSLAVTSSTGESNGNSSPQNKEIGTVAANSLTGEAKLGHVSDPIAEKSDQEQVIEFQENSVRNSSRSPSIDLSSDLVCFLKIITSRSSQSAEEMEKENSTNLKSNEIEKEPEDIQENYVNSSSIGVTLTCLDHKKDVQNGLTYDETTYNCRKYTEKGIMVEEKGQQIEIESSSGFSQVKLENGLHSPKRVNNNYSDFDRMKHVKSVRSSGDSSMGNGSSARIQVGLADTHDKPRFSTSIEPKDTKLYKKETRNLLSDSRIQHLEHRIKNLEVELMESAAIEASLYSVVAEHGSSTTKVHAPARRLTRLYFHANKHNSKVWRGSGARSIVSGLMLVAKACGNDVPRLTFWLSNSIALRAIMNMSFGDHQLPVSVGPVTVTAGEMKGNKKTSPLKWGSSSNKNFKNPSAESFGDWNKPLTFTSALEKVESWIFNRIIESLWWQTFTPHMQSGATKEIRNSMNSDSSRTASSIDQEQGNYSLELWKKAFRDACERICPVRAGGHSCGCLPVLSRLIMDQLIARLDVAMFNAILRESADEIPTDPVADPISDAEVLPIPAGKASFGAGAQLKNAIGNWSRWLTDLFGIGEDYLLETENISETANDDDELRSNDTSKKSFYLLNALSDLMMLPKDMLLSRTIRKEVCPTFGPLLIRKVLNTFIPDEFCPDPIPGVVLEALNSEDPFDSEDDSIMDFPCDAAPVIYQPPSAASVSSIFGGIGDHPQLTRSGSSVLKKSQTSDDELDELDSPLKSIILDSFHASASSVKPSWVQKENRSASSIRYQLLREVWMNSE